MYNKQAAAQLNELQQQIDQAILEMSKSYPFLKLSKTGREGKLEHEGSDRLTLKALQDLRESFSTHE